MKILLYVFILVYLNLPSAAQQTHWSWAKIGYNIDMALGTNVCIDMNDNVYATGSFKNTLNLDTFSIVSLGDFDAFLIKLNATGECVWAKSIGGIGDDASNFSGISLLSIDSLGNSYLSFPFSDTVKVDGFTIASEGYTDIAMIKFDKNGNVIWCKSFGTIENDRPKKIILWHDKLYLCGEFSINGTESIQLDTVTLTSKGGGDIFLVKMDTSGVVIWARNEGTPLNENAESIDADKSGNIFLSGNVGSTIYFAHDTLSNPNFGHLDFVVKYDSTGDELWAKPAFHDGVYYGGDIVTDTNGNVYKTGYTTDDNIIKFGSINLNNYYYNKAYLAKYSPNGQLLFAKKISTYTFYDALNSIKLNPIDNTIYLCGRYNYLATFGADTLHSYGHDDILLLKMNEQGNILWSTHAGGISADGAIGLAVAPNGDLVLTGYTSSSNCNFGNIQVSAQNGWDIFVARLSQTSDVADNDKESKEIKVFPNPAENTVFVHADDALERIVVYDITGRHVLDWQPDSVPKNKVCLNIEGLVNGLYFITTTINDLQSKPKQLLVHH